MKAKVREMGLVPLKKSHAEKSLNQCFSSARRSNDAGADRGHAGIETAARSANLVPRTRILTGGGESSRGDQ